MKRIILIICAVLSLAGCKKLFNSAVESMMPDPEMTFKADGEEFTAIWSKGSKTVGIIDSSDKGFAITFTGSNWDTENTLKSAEICLNCGFFDGTLKEDVEYGFSAEEMDACPYFYCVTSVLQEPSVYRSKGMWYNATDGWIKITKINKKKGQISGKFAFTAVCDDPSDEDVIEITNGAFWYIPYKVLEDHDDTK